MRQWIASAALALFFAQGGVAASLAFAQDDLSSVPSEDTINVQGAQDGSLQASDSATEEARRWVCFARPRRGFGEYRGEGWDRREAENRALRECERWSHDHRCYISRCDRFDRLGED